MLPFRATGQTVLDKLDSLYYPPSLTGLRGSHPGSNAHAHDRVWTKKSDWGPTTKLKESYDLGCCWRRDQRTGGSIFLPAKARGRQEGAYPG